jgi:hypothetical protein
MTNGSLVGDSGMSAIEKKLEIADKSAMTKSDALPPKLTVTGGSTLPALPTGWHAMQYRALNDCKLAVIVADMDFASEWMRIYSADGAANPPSRILEMVDVGTARLMVLHDGAWHDSLRFPVEFAHPILDQFTDGRWLIVGSRTNNKPNARIFALDGTLLARFMLGDGIEHIAIDRADNIWVGWFDEGIFGNTGWQVLGEEWPPSSRGIGCFDANGEILPLPDLPEAGMIADCYALMAGKNDAWACTYTDFPILHLRPDQPMRWWKNNHGAPRALAIDGSHALIAGGYGAKANQLDGSGQGENARQLARRSMPLRRLPVSAHHVWDSPTLLAGHGDTIHLIDDGVWYRWRVAEVLAQLKE